MKFLQTYRLFENDFVSSGDEALCINADADGNDLEYGKVYTVQKTRQSFGLQVKLIDVKFFWDTFRFIFDPIEIKNWKFKNDVNKYNL